MNVMDANVLKELTEAFQWLQLTERNTKIAWEYFTAATADDTLLEQVEKQKNFRGMPRDSVHYAFNGFVRYGSRSGMNCLDRVLKFLWAAGGTVVCEMVSMTYLIGSPMATPLPSGHPFWAMFGRR